MTKNTKLSGTCRKTHSWRPHKATRELSLRAGNQGVSPTSWSMTQATFIGDKRKIGPKKLPRYSASMTRRFISLSSKLVDEPQDTITRAVARKKLQPRRTHGPLYEISGMKSSNIIKNRQYLVKFYRGECLGSPHTGYGGDYTQLTTLAETTGSSLSSRGCKWQ